MEVTVPEYRIEPGISIPAAQSALLIIDMLFDFADPRGRLFVPDAPKTIPPIRQLIDRARSSKSLIIYILDWHRPDDPEFSIWPPHAVQDSKGGEIISELAPFPQDYIVRKRTYDPFFATDLDLLLRQKGIQYLVITGTVANICVLHAAGSASLRGYRVVVPIDSISALNPFDMAIALRQISFVYQGKLTHAKALQFKSK